MISVIIALTHSSSESPSSIARGLSVACATLFTAEPGRFLMHDLLLRVGQNEATLRLGVIVGHACVAHTNPHPSLKLMGSNLTIRGLLEPPDRLIRELRMCDGGSILGP